MGIIPQQWLGARFVFYIQPVKNKYAVADQTLL